MIIKKNIVFIGICCTYLIIPSDQHPDQAIALVPCMPHTKKKTSKAPRRSILVKKTTPTLCSCFCFACLCSRSTHAPTSPPQQQISKKVILKEENNIAIAEPVQALVEELLKEKLTSNWSQAWPQAWPIIAQYIAEEPPCDKVPTFHELTVEIVRTPKNKDTRLELSIIRELDKIYYKPAYKRTLCEVSKTWNKHYPEQESDENFG